MQRFKLAKRLTVRNVGLLLALSALFIAVMGLSLRQVQASPTEPYGLQDAILELWANVSTELASIAITVLIIDGLYQRRESEREKERLVRQMSSKDEAMALNAVDELRANNALKDGSLVGVDLSRANLKGARLGNSDLRRVNLFEANLQNADLYLTELQGAQLVSTLLQDADMLYVNLQNADVRGANLRGADLREANLQDARFENAKLDENTRLPDGSRWSVNTNMTRFTDPNHEQFWRSENPYSPAHSGDAPAGGTPPPADPNSTQEIEV